MGMYNDFSNTNRTDWKYTYKGKELLEVAKIKQAEYRIKEEEARRKIAALMLDMTASTLGTIAEDFKKQATEFGRLREQCDVFVHAFTRTPEREFHLSLGDVTFFGLQENANG